jgi:hypothetical protein
VIVLNERVAEFVYICNTFNAVEFSTKLLNSTNEIVWIKCSIDSKDHFVAACHFPAKPKHATEMFIRQSCRAVECIRDDFDDPSIIATGDFNHLNTDLLVTDYGFNLLTNTVIHGSKVLGRTSVNWPSTYIISVANSLIKTKHKAVIAGDYELSSSSRCKVVYVYDQNSL